VFHLRRTSASWNFRLILTACFSFPHGTLTLSNLEKANLQKHKGETVRKAPKPVPPGMKVQLERLFGSDSPEAKAAVRTDAQWRQTLSSVLAELFKYLEQNVHTDDMHWTMLCTGFAAAADSLKHDDFWPGYAEGITRIALLLMGDYPDHKTRGAGQKKK
jgi:hypothetical protein